MVTLSIYIDQFTFIPRSHNCNFFIIHFNIIPKIFHT